jgi:predicted O-linked N-acetylglucosamine transferase (SPINDLY family)
MTTDVDLQHAVNHHRAEQTAALASEFIATLETLSEKGLHDNAEALARQMILILPDHGFGWKTLAYAYLRRGDLAGALDPLQKAAALLLEDADVGRHLYAATAMQQATTLDKVGKFNDAGKLYQEVLNAYPDHPDANHKLGVIAIRLCQPEAALPYLERALGVNPNNGQYWANYLDALVQAGQLKTAWMALEMAQQRGVSGPTMDALIALMTALSTQTTIKLPRSMQGDGQEVQQETKKSQLKALARKAKSRGGANPAEPSQQQLDALVALYNSGRVEEAAASARRLIKRFPLHGLGWKVLGVSLHRLGELDEALEAVQMASELSPQDVDLLQVSTSILQSSGRHKEAEADCRRLLEIDPNHAEGLRILGIILMTIGQLAEAEAVSRRAIEATPDSALACCTLGVIYMQQGRLSESSALFRRATEIDPNGEIFHNNLVFSLTHSENVGPDELFAQHCRFGEHFETPLKPHWPKHDNSKDPHRCLRVGFISGDFRHHAVTNFLEPVLTHLPRDGSLSLYAYSNTPGEDHVSERLRKHFTHWRRIFAVKDDEVAAQIRADGIDILIDLAGHTANNRLLTLARKPAPVQATWIGYPGTTGLSAVDYFLADRFWVPSDKFRNQFTEKIAYLPAVAPFLPEAMSPPVNHLPALHNGYITFGSFNRLDKLRREVIALWSQLLHALPNSRMLLGAMPRDGSYGELVDWFAEEGIARDRLDIRVRSAIPVYLQQHHHVDICLDTFPFTGLTTTLHALWMGVPTLTLPGQTVVGRSGVTALAHVGLDAFIAEDKEDYVRRAVELAADLPALAALRSDMRARCEKSPMFRPDVIADGVVRALRVMWRRWCDGLPAESFDVSQHQTQESFHPSRS